MVFQKVKRKLFQFVLKFIFIQNTLTDISWTKSIDKSPHSTSSPKLYPSQLRWSETIITRVRHWLIRKRTSITSLTSSNRTRRSPTRWTNENIRSTKRSGSLMSRFEWPERIWIDCSTATTPRTCMSQKNVTSIKD